MFSYKQLSLCLSLIFSLKYLMADMSNHRNSHFAAIFSSSRCRGGKKRQEQMGDDTILIMICMSLLYRYLAVFATL